MRIVRSPPSGIASRALTARLTMTCSNWPMSTFTGQRSRPWSTLSLIWLPTQARQQHAQVGQHVGEVEHLRPQRLLAREGQQLPDQRRRAVGVLLDVHDVGEGRVRRAVVGEQQVRRHDDGGQHVVEVVRDAAGELADRLHLLALRHLAFERLLLGGVDGVDDRRFLGASSPPVPSATALT